MYAKQLSNICFYTQPSLFTPLGLVNYDRILIHYLSSLVIILYRLQILTMILYGFFVTQP